MTETPEDIDNLYSRARIEWTRYWDFSGVSKASPAATRTHSCAPGMARLCSTHSGISAQAKEQPPQVQLQEVKMEDPGPIVSRHLRQPRVR